MCLLLFVPAGTVRYWQACYLGVFFAIAGLMTLDLMRNDPELLRRRIHGGPAAEKEISQQVIMLLASAGFIGLTGRVRARSSVSLVQPAPGPHPRR